MSMNGTKAKQSEAKASKANRTKQDEIVSFNLEPYIQSMVEDWLKSNGIKASDVRHNISKPIVYYNPVIG